MTDVLNQLWLDVCKTQHNALHCYDLSELETRTRLDSVVAINDEMAHLLCNQNNADVLVRTDTPVLMRSIMIEAMQAHSDKMRETGMKLTFTFARDDLRCITFVHSELPAPSARTKDLYVIKDSGVYKEDVE